MDKATEAEIRKALVSVEASLHKDTTRPLYWITEAIDYLHRAHDMLHGKSSERNPQ